MRHKGPGADTVPMLGYVDRRCDDLSCRIQLLDEDMSRRVAGLKEAIEQSRAAMDLRLAGMNEWRAQSNDRQREFPTRDVLDEIAKGLRDQDVQQEARLRRLEGRVTADEGGDATATRLREARRSNLTLFAVVATALLFLVSVALSVVIATHGG